MNKIELLNTLITHYSSVIEEVKKREWEDMCHLDGYLEERKVNCGVCKCSDDLFDTYIYQEEWIDKRKVKTSSLFGDYWGLTPYHLLRHSEFNSDTIEKVINSLQLRVNILKQELELETK